MARGKTASAPANTPNEPERDSDGLWTTRQAATYLGIQKTSFDAAIKRNDYLREGLVVDKYPGLEIVRKRLHPDLVRRFAEERNSSGHSQSRGGQKRFTAFLTEPEVETASRAVSEALGREVEFKRLYKNRSKTAGPAESNSAVDSDDGDDGDTYDEEEEMQGVSAETTRLF